MRRTVSCGLIAAMYAVPGGGGGRVVFADIVLVDRCRGLVVLEWLLVRFSSIAFNLSPPFKSIFLRRGPLAALLHPWKP